RKSVTSACWPRRNRSSGLNPIPPAARRPTLREAPVKPRTQSDRRQERKQSTKRTDLKSVPLIRPRQQFLMDSFEQSLRGANAVRLAHAVAFVFDAEEAVIFGV